MVLRRQQLDRVPYDINNFNRESSRLFQEKTGSDDLNKYFDVQADIAWIDFKNTNLSPEEVKAEVKERIGG